MGLKQHAARPALRLIRAAARIAATIGRLPGATYLRFVGLRSAAEHAVEAGDPGKALQLARELLALADRYRTDWYHGNAIHHAHGIIGRAALLRHDVKAAQVELLLSAQTPGSPQLSSFGPNMRLAQQLLAMGHRDTVLEYLDLCGRFWPSGRQRLTRWSADVSADRPPDFGANLLY